MIIYKITNLINNKQYIGQTIKTKEQRWREHISPSSRCTYIKNAIQKYGKENFIIEQIDSAESLSELNEKEKYWIDKLNSLTPNGYNLRTGGDNHKASEDTKRKMSISNKSKPPKPINSTRYKGVHFNKRMNGFYAEIVHNGSRRFLGIYDSDIDAAKACDLYTHLNIGYGYLNFPNDIDERAFDKKRKRAITKEQQNKISEVQRGNHKNQGLYSKYKGVSFDKSRGRRKWIASLVVDKKKVLCKRFETEIEAALAYDEAVKVYVGAIGYLNLPDPTELHDTPLCANLGLDCF